jgi:hypothetical protein
MFEEFSNDTSFDPALFRLDITVKGFMYYEMIKQQALV